MLFDSRLNENTFSREIVYQLIAVHAIPPVDVKSINDDTSLIEELGYDSMGFIELIVAIEEECGLEIKEDNLFFENFETPRKVVIFLSSNGAK